MTLLPYLSLILGIFLSIGFLPVYATEIGHAYDAITTGFVTTATTETDVDNIYLTSGNFTVGDKYLIIGNAETNCSVASCDVEIHYEHGTTDFTESFNRLEQDDTAAYYTHTWFTVWTAVSNEGIQMEIISPTAGTKTVDQASIIAINLSDLTENTDWFYE